MKSIFAEFVFVELRKLKTKEEILEQFSSCPFNVKKELGISTIEDLNIFMKEFVYKSELLDIEDTLENWMERFIKDKHGIMNLCLTLNEENEFLKEKIDGMKSFEKRINKLEEEIKKEQVKLNNLIAFREAEPFIIEKMIEKDTVCS